MKSLFSSPDPIVLQRVAQIQKALNTPAKTLERWIKTLKKHEKIEYRGSKKTGGYYVK